MQIEILTQGNAQVTIGGINVSFVYAAILTNPNQDQTEIIGTLQTFLNNQVVISNVSGITASIQNNVNIDPEDLIEECNQAVINAITALGYGVNII